MAFDKLKVYLKKAKFVFIGLGLIIGSVVIVLGMHALKPKPEKEESEKAPLVVRTAPAQLKEQTVSSTFQGLVRAKTNIELVTQVAGKVTYVSEKFVEGGRFEEGETLLKIDDSDYLVALKSAEASVASASVDLEVERASAATNAKEWQTLQNKPLDQANPLRLNKPQVSRAIARLDAAKAELAAAKLNYDRTKISAPFAGRIMTKTAELGQFMARGASVGRVFATDVMEVRIPMTDIQIDELGLTLGYSSSSLSDPSVKSIQNKLSNKLNKQLNEQSALAATVSAVFGIERHTWLGYLKSVDASIDNQTRLIYATIIVDKPFDESDARPMPLAPGLFVDVALASPEKLKGIEIPRAALRNGNQVYVYSDEKLRLQPVKVIYTSESVVMLSQGSQTKLVADELVITSSVPGAYDGMPVKLFKPIKTEEVAEPNDETDEAGGALIEPAEAPDDQQAKDGTQAQTES